MQGGEEAAGSGVGGWAEVGWAEGDGCGPLASSGAGVAAAGAAFGVVPRRRGSGIRSPVAVPLSGGEGAGEEEEEEARARVEAGA